MKTLLGFVLAFSALTLVLVPSAEAGRRCSCGGGYAPAATGATAQADSGYRSYSYEPGAGGVGNNVRSSRPADRSFRDATFKASGRQN